MGPGGAHQCFWWTALPTPVLYAAYPGQCVGTAMSTLCKMVNKQPYSNSELQRLTAGVSFSQKSIMYCMEQPCYGMPTCYRYAERATHPNPAFAVQL